MKAINVVLLILVFVSMFVSGYFIAKTIYQKKPTVVVETVTDIDTVFVSVEVPGSEGSASLIPAISDVDSLFLTEHHVATIDTVLVSGRSKTSLVASYDTKPRVFSLQWETSYPVDSVYVYRDVIKTVYVDKEVQAKVKKVLPIIGFSTMLTEDDKPNYSVSVGFRLWNRIDALLGTSTNRQLIVGIGYRM